ncbi:MAG: tetratricopeptide repeat protein [Bacteroidia bacterium]|nr:tetratricopeptide repeat protein [Bacteroidia bacterium]
MFLSSFTLRLLISSLSIFVIAIILPLNLCSQNQKLADSLEIIYKSGVYPKSEKLTILKKIVDNQADVDQAINYADILLKEAQALDSVYYVVSAYLEIGNAHRLRGDYFDALETFFKAAEIAIAEENTLDLALTQIAIADVYSTTDDHENALSYYEKGIKTLRRSDDSIGLASALLNIGDEYFNIGEDEKAMSYYRESGEIFKKQNFELGSAYNLGNIGLIHARQGNHAKAEDQINEAVTILEKLEDYYPICVYYTYLSDIYSDQGNIKKSLDYVHYSLDLAEKYGLKQEISNAHLKLSDLHMDVNEVEEAFDHFKDYISYRDSITNLQSVQERARLQKDFELSQKQVEVDLLNQQKENQRITILATVITLGLIVLLAIGLFRRNRFIHKTKEIIESEKERSDKLLLNILPEETAHELKEYGRVQAKRFNSATILFTDFVGFTSHSENLAPEILVESIDYYFSAFDDIVEKYDLEKIKTTGDAFICAGGLPFETNDHAIRIVHAAIDIIAFVEESKQDENSDNIKFDIRVGINTGPVVAGVVGTKKFAYDIWGDTVNVASRLESSSLPGKINLSEDTFELVKDHFTFDPRGPIPVKNHGNINMYFVLDRIKEFELLEL